MNLEEMLKLADEIIFMKTGQHLDDLQDAVLRGTLQRDTYKQIAKDFDCSESHVRQTGSQLWQILSEELGEEVSKSNLRSTMGRLQVSIYSNIAQEESVQIICGEGKHPLDIPNSYSHNPERSNTKQTATSHQDLSEMPELGNFYDRASELETLATWILQQNCRLIALTGIGGIGKTTLAVQLVQQIKNEFEYVIWCSLELSPTLAEFQDKLIQLIPQSEESSLSTHNTKKLPLIKYLQKYRCLAVLDDMQNLFHSGELAGKYKPDREDYKAFFKQLGKLSHQNCFLLIGWEPPQEFTQVTSKPNSIRTLQLAGLNIAAGREILREYGLAEIENWEAIIDRYQGNPFWIKSVATLVQELGEGATELLTNDRLLLPENLKDSLQQQCDRLSDIEKQLFSLLAKKDAPVNLAKLLESSGMPASNLLNALQSLFRRCFLEQQESFYTLPPILKEYALRLNSTLSNS